MATPTGPAPPCSAPTARWWRAAVNAMDYTPDGKRVVAASDGGLLMVWDVPAGTATTIAFPTTEEIRAVAVSADGTLLATGGTDAVVRLWDVGTGRPHGSPLTGHAERIFSLAFSPDGRTLVS